tara:strand:- start:16 stop:408 length:393 start_codon:yes stop_codon:yes gene_type:complete
MMEEIITVEGKRFYKKFYEHCLKHDLWIGFAREREENSTYDETYRMVKMWLEPLITDSSNLTKGALMKYARENYTGPCAYKDVGKVVSRIINDECTNRFGKWCRATNKQKIRLRGKNNARIQQTVQRSNT